MGIILLVAVAVILASVTATFALDILDGTQVDGPTANFDYDYDPDTGLVEITHSGGGTIDTSNFVVSGSRSRAEEWETDTLEVGTSVTYPALPGDEIRVVWQDGQQGRQLGTYTVPEASGSVTVVDWNRQIRGDSLAAFMRHFEEDDNGLMWRENGDRIEAAEETENGYGTYRTTLPDNTGQLTVDIDFEGDGPNSNQFSDSGIVFVAVDADGTAHIVDSPSELCDESNGDVTLGCADGSDDASFTWDGTYTLSTSAELESFYIRIDMENIPGDWLDQARFYSLRVTVS